VPASLPLLCSQKSFRSCILVTPTTAGETCSTTWVNWVLISTFTTDCSNDDGESVIFPLSEAPWSSTAWLFFTKLESKTTGIATTTSRIPMIAPNKIGISQLCLFFFELCGYLLPLYSITLFPYNISAFTFNKTNRLYR